MTWSGITRELCSAAKPKLESEFRKLETAARKEFRGEGWAGVAHFERSLDLRYRGQGYELNVPVTKNVVDQFHEEHQRRYGYHHPEREIELVTVRLRARLRTPPLLTRPKSKVARTARTAAAEPAPLEFAQVVFNNRLVRTPVFQRADFVPDLILRGPAIVTEYSATTVIPRAKQFWMDAAENLVIKMN